MSNHTTIIDSKIEARLHDDAWSSSMARRVLGRRKTIVRRRMAGGLALIVCAVLTGYLLLTGGPPRPSGLENMITSQVNGTYGTVFTSGTAAQAVDSALFSDVDSLVDTALAQR